MRRGCAAFEHKAVNQLSQPPNFFGIVTSHRDRVSNAVYTLGHVRVIEPDELLNEASNVAKMIGTGPTYANAMTKRMLAMEWAMSVEEAIEAEAVAQALCMTTEDFARAYRAFAAMEKPAFKGD